MSHSELVDMDRYSAFGQMAGGSGQVFIPHVGDAPGGDIHTECDNAPSVRAGNKLYSGAWPMAYFVVNFNHWPMVCNFLTIISHRLGVLNDWVDELRRLGASELESRGWNVSVWQVWQTRTLQTPRDSQ